MFRPIYQPRTRAREYCDLAVNIYESCPHGCTYCYARAMAKRFGKPWREGLAIPRPNIVEAVKRQLEGMQSQGKKIMLCFTCDPYPIGHDSTTTREVIRVIKQSGNHVQILTKGDETAQRDFDLLDGQDSFGVSWTGGNTYYEPNAAWHSIRMSNLIAAKERSINTWISCEPVIDPASIFLAIKTLDCVDIIRIGKLNHYKSKITWPYFGRIAEELCQKHNRNYYIKEDLRREMEKQQ